MAATPTEQNPILGSLIHSLTHCPPMAAQVLSPASTKRPLEDDPLQETQGNQKKARVDSGNVSHYFLLVGKKGVTKRIRVNPQITLSETACACLDRDCIVWEDDRDNGTARLCVFYPDEDFDQKNPVMGEFLEAIGIRIMYSPSEVLIGRYDGRPFVTKHVEALERVAAWARLVTEMSDEYNQIEQERGDDYEGPDEEPEFPDAPDLEEISDCEEEEENSVSK